MRTGAPSQKIIRIGSVLLIAVGLFLTLCLLSYQPADIPLLSSAPQRPAFNLCGSVGAWIGFVGRAGFGWACLIVPVVCFLWSWRLWRGSLAEMDGITFTLGSFALMASLGTLFALDGANDFARTELGGVTGFLCSGAGTYYLGLTGTILAASFAAILSWWIVTGQPIGGRELVWFGRGWGALSAGWGGAAVSRRQESRVGRERAEPAAVRGRKFEKDDKAEDESEAFARGPADALAVRIRSTVEPKRKPSPPPAPIVRQAPGGYQFPSMDLLTTPPPVSQRQITDDLQRNARILEDTLRDFGIEARVDDIDRGPTVTRYELTPAPGVKLTKIAALSDEIALVMKAASCHVVAPLPGKGRVGIDVPNTITTTVYLKEILTSEEFTSKPSPLLLPIGKDVSGNSLVIDLRECPHLLVAGATGSGKTVCLNGLLVGILSRVTPDQVKFVMIDPKMVELSMFNDIPHLACPVVTNSKKASVALHWAVQEMERRYQLLAKLGVRNIDGYNTRMKDDPPPKKKQPAPVEGEQSGDRQEGDDLEHDGPLSYLVIVIDELADLMMVAAQDVEGAIARLAQMSRAVGIHMILATQRPSVDVITGVIKANFPARLAFQVASKVDSRTILDMNGADKLLGRGDLLFLKPGAAKPVRAQGALVTDGEIEKFTTFLKQQGSPLYDDRLLQHQRQPESVLGGGGKDELYDTAMQLVLDTGQASTSLLQRRLRIGYGRAARILDTMEQEGLIGPPQGSRPREVLVSRDRKGP